MLKISQIRTAGESPALKLEGRVAGPWVEELSRACETLLAAGEKLELDLADVSFVDAQGVSMLSRFRSRGAKLTNCSPFVEEQLKTTIAG